MLLNDHRNDFEQNDADHVHHTLKCEQMAVNLTIRFDYEQGNTFHKMYYCQIYCVDNFNTQ